MTLYISIDYNPSYCLSWWLWSYIIIFFLKSLSSPLDAFNVLNYRHFLLVYHHVDSILVHSHSHLKSSTPFLILLLLITSTSLAFLVSGIHYQILIFSLSLTCKLSLQYVIIYSSRLLMEVNPAHFILCSCCNCINHNSHHKSHQLSINFLFYINYYLEPSVFAGFPSALHPSMFLCQFCAVKLNNNNNNNNKYNDERLSWLYKMKLLSAKNWPCCHVCTICTPAVPR